MVMPPDDAAGMAKAGAAPAGAAATAAGLLQEPLLSS